MAESSGLKTKELPRLPLRATPKIARVGSSARVRQSDLWRLDAAGHNQDCARLIRADDIDA